MKFKDRIFLTVLLISGLSLIASTILSYSYFSKMIESRFTTRYQSLVNNFGTTIEIMDKISEKNMRTAALYLDQQFKMGGKIDSATLQKEAKLLGVSGIEIANRDGKFIAASLYDYKAIPNLFEIWNGYRGLLNGTRENVITPLVPSIVDQRIMKFYVIPTSDKKYLIDITQEINFLEKALRSVILADDTVKMIALDSPTGVHLGAYSRDQDKIKFLQGEGPSPVDLEDSMTLRTVANPTETDCGECFNKKLVATPETPMTYTVKAIIDKSALHKNLRSLAFILAGLCTLFLTISFYAASKMSRYLNQRFSDLMEQTRKAVESETPTDITLGALNDEFGTLAKQFNRLLDKIAEKNSKLRVSEKKEAEFKIAAQVSHDIRSPLAALEMVLPSISELPEDKRLIIRNSINRIRDIANGLLNKNKEKLAPFQYAPTPEIGTHYLSPLIDSVISEKRLQFRNQLNIEIDFNHSRESYGLFANIEPNDFKNVVSNLINNAVEAMGDGSGKIRLELNSENNTEIVLKIFDNGKGIPPKVLPLLTQKGMTFGKANGNGLGLYHAKETLTKLGGTIEITSQTSKIKTRGTCVTLRLPKAKVPDWFVHTIKLNPKIPAIVFDDDQTIHQIWQGRFDSALMGQKPVQMQHFSSHNALRKFFGQNFDSLDQALFLMDYEIIGQSESGLDLVEELGIHKQSILVTSRYEEPQVRERCKRLGVRLIPKPMSAFVPIEVVN